MIMSSITTEEAIRKLEGLVDLHTRYMNNCVLIEEPILAAAVAKVQHKDIQALMLAIAALRKEL